MGIVERRVGLWWFEGELPPCLLFIGGTGNILHFFVTRRDLGCNLEYEAKSKAEDIGMMNSGNCWVELTQAFVRISLRRRRCKTASQICRGGKTKKPSSGSKGKEMLVTRDDIPYDTHHVARLPSSTLSLSSATATSSFKFHRMLSETNKFTASAWEK
jgi:hypothetical protein